jgi:hypothetical protein
MTMPLLLYGQQAVLSAGGGGSGSGGTSSYSVGQVAYTYKGPGPSVDEGVQQAFEVTNLPVELLYFEAEALEDRIVELSWETLSEEDNDYFTVERSLDGRDWEYVGKVSGAGTSAEPLRYELRDMSPYKGSSYYRLQQTDYDGSFSYSDTREVWIMPSMISMYPNPVKGRLTVETEEYPLRYQLSDTSGRLLKRGELLDSRVELDLTSLEPGVYTLRLESDSVSSITQKIIKIGR